MKNFIKTTLTDNRKCLIIVQFNQNTSEVMHFLKQTVLWLNMKIYILKGKCEVANFPKELSLLVICKNRN